MNWIVGWAAEAVPLWEAGAVEVAEGLGMDAHMDMVVLGEGRIELVAVLLKQVEDTEAEEYMIGQVVAAPASTIGQAAGGMVDPGTDELGMGMDMGTGRHHKAEAVGTQVASMPRLYSETAVVLDNRKGTQAALRTAA